MPGRNPLRFYRWPTRLLRPLPPQVETITSPGWSNLAPAPSPTPASILIRSAPRMTNRYSREWIKNTNYSAAATNSPATFIQPGHDRSKHDGTNVNDVSVQCNGHVGRALSRTRGARPWAALLAMELSRGRRPSIRSQSIQMIRNGLISPFRGLSNFESTFHTWATYHVTLIVSCGSDDNTSLGLYGTGSIQSISAIWGQAQRRRLGGH